MIDLTVAEIKKKLQEADAETFAVLERSLVADTRKGVRSAVEVARRRIDAELREQERVRGMYAYEKHLAETRGGKVVLGLDEVGRGPLAGPLAVGGVVLDGVFVEGINDSKQVKPEDRARIAEFIRASAPAWTVQYVDPADIDAHGMTASLKSAFRRAIEEIERQGVEVDVVLLDGNPLGIDDREVNVVKGDAQCASIAAASIVAKVARDELMVSLDRAYPEYAFAANKGYASPEHIEAIKTYGLTPVHRVSFCSAFTQPTLF